MKKFVLFVMLMMSVVSVSAQRWSLTPEVGMTAVKRGGFSYIDEPGYTWNARWKIGVGVEYVVKPDRFSLKSGLYYAQRGYSRQSTSFGNIYPTIDDQSESTFSKSYYKTRRHFLQVPLMANLSFRLADNVRLNLAAGPYIAYSMGDKNIAVYNEYTPGNSSGHESYGSMNGKGARLVPLHLEKSFSCHLHHTSFLSIFLHIIPKCRISGHRNQRAIRQINIF